LQHRSSPDGLTDGDTTVVSCQLVHTARIRYDGAHLGNRDRGFDSRTVPPQHRRSFTAWHQVALAGLTHNHPPALLHRAPRTTAECTCSNRGSTMRRCAHARLRASQPNLCLPSRALFAPYIFKRLCSIAALCSPPASSANRTKPPVQLHQRSCTRESGSALAALLL
jgi:hypothetical protein